MRTVRGAIPVLTVLAAGAPPVCADEWFIDPAGDAVIRRTDLGAVGPINPASVLPDLLSVRMRGWLPLSPAEPYQGTPVPSAGAHVFRMDVQFQGLVNPPGPVDSAPFLYGESPVYGVVELDIDADRDTGGELGGAAHYRFLANAARFGALPSGPLGERAARSAADLDLVFATAPQHERSGADFALVLCGCEPLVIVSEGGNLNGRFDAGETWVVRGRFFQRAGGYRLASAVVGGSDFGLYDPLVNLRFSHDPVLDRTTVSLVYALDMQGASMLTGQPQQPIDTVIDLPVGGVANHSSVVEAVTDLINGALGLNGGPLSGPTFVLTDRWRLRQAQDVLDCQQWRVVGALVGTAYAEPGPWPYVWTDIGFGNPRGDCDGDGFVGAADRAAVAAYISTHDGGPGDADGTVNQQVILPEFAVNFCPFDVDGDGVVGPADLAFFGSTCPGDWNGDGQVTPQDLSMFVAQWLVDVSGGGLLTDLDNNGVADPADISLFIAKWFRCL
jgi:hypothetical protein